MKPPLDFYLLAHAYDRYGGHTTLGLIPPFLLLDAPDFGPGIAELSITLHFQTKGPPRFSLEQSYAHFHSKRLTLPKVVFRRSRQKASIDIASELMDGDEWEFRRGYSLSLFNAGLEEVIGALNLLRMRVTPKDSFRLDLFLSHCEGRRSTLPHSEEALTALNDQVEATKTAALEAMSPWERLGIEWRDFHPEARSVLDDPFFWEQANDFSPHGNDTGADLLADYRKWLKRHPDDDPVDFYKSLAKDWGFSLEEDDTADQQILDEAAVALAFAELKLRGACRTSAAELAMKAVQRQRAEALAAHDWAHRDDRLRSLDAIEGKLQRIS